MTDKTVKRDIASYDILKLILSILILAINCLNLGLGKADFYIVEYVARLAVPLFFCMSGYFLFLNYNTDNHERSKAHFKKYELNLIKMFLIWNAVYLVIKIYEWYHDHTGLIDILKYFWYVCLGIQYQQLWYLGASIVGAFLVWVLLKKLSIKKILVISFLCYAVALVFFTYSTLTTPFIEKSRVMNFLFVNYNRFFSTFRNGVFFGFPFIAMGAYMAISPPKNQSVALNLPVFSAGMVLLLFETRYLSTISAPYHGLMLFLLVVTPTAFILVGKIKLKPSPAYRYIRKISTYVFLDQFIPIFIFDEFISRNTEVNYLFRYLFCVVSSLVIAVIIVFAKEKIGGKKAALKN